MEELTGFIRGVWPYLVTASPAAWLLYLRWSDSKKQFRAERADLIQIAQEAAGHVIGDLRAEIDRLRTEMAELHTEIATARKEHAVMLAQKDAEITMLRGELRQREALLEAYERVLKANNIDPPKQNRTWVLDGGELHPAAGR